MGKTELSIERSFPKDSEGQRLSRLIGTDGKPRFDSLTYKIGLSAFDQLWDEFSKSESGNGSIGEFIAWNGICCLAVSKAFVTVHKEKYSESELSLLQTTECLPLVFSGVLASVHSAMGIGAYTDQSKMSDNIASLGVLLWINHAFLAQSNNDFEGVLTAGREIQFCSEVQDLGPRMQLAFDLKFSARMKENAEKTHKENRQMKEECFRWCESNLRNFRSINAAAEHLRDVYPVAYTTLQRWVGEWSRSNRGS